MNSEFANFVLPVTIVGRADVNRLFREAEVLDNFIVQDAVRTPGVQPKMPQTTRSMDDFCRTNQLNLLQTEQRTLVLDFLRYLKKSAPVIHLSFAVEPSPMFMQKMVTWIRGNLDPQALILVGLAPGIVAGCVVRTTNKVFDFGLKKRFEASKPILIEQIQALTANLDQAEAAAPEIAVTQQPVEPITEVAARQQAPAAPVGAAQ